MSAWRNQRQLLNHSSGVIDHVFDTNSGFQDYLKVDAIECWNNGILKKTNFHHSNIPLFLFLHGLKTLNSEKRGVRYYPIKK